MAKYLDYEGLKHYNEKLSTTTLAKKLDKTGGTISGDLTVQKKLKCETAPTENNDVIRKLELDAKSSFSVEVW